MIKLYIENREIELDKSVQFALNKQFEDVTNPTTIINSWSKTVSIPFTTKNNAIFGNIFNPDKVNVKGVPTDYLPSMYIHRTESYWAKYNKKTGTYVGTSQFKTTVPTYEGVFVVRRYLGNTGGERSIFYNTGFKTYTFTKDSSFDKLTIYYNYARIGGVNDDLGNVFFDCAPLENGKTYTLSFSVDEIGTQTAPNLDCVVNGLCLVEGNTAYSWKSIYEFNDIGIYFNPLKKLDFRLEWDSAVLMTGYAKMNEIKQNNGKGTYEITLFGELGKVFSEMKKITFDTTSEDTDYIIDGREYVDEYINRDLVYNSWTSTGQTTDNLYKKMYVNIDRNRVVNPNYKVTDIIGFAPNNAFNEDFDYESLQGINNTVKKFTDILSGLTQDTGIDAESIIPNGLLPREIGEYRSYLQLPYIYWNKLFQIFINKLKEVTEYDVNLDSDWFNTNNPYWYKLVYMLKPFDTKKNIAATNYYDTSTSEGLYWVATDLTTNKSAFIVVEEPYIETIPIVHNVSGTSKFNTFEDISYMCNFNLGMRIQIQPKIESSVIYHTKLSPSNALIIKVTLIDSNNVEKQEENIIVCNSEYTGSTFDYIKVICDSPQYASSYDEYLINPTLFFKVLQKDFPTDFAIKVDAHWINTNPPFKANGSNYVRAHYLRSTYGTQKVEIQFNKNIRTNSHFVLNDLWNNDYNLFEEIIKYCKMYRIGVFVDEINKVIDFKRLPNYFSTYTISDWGDKLDKSKDYTVKPITFDDKYVLFNYEDSETQLGKAYKEKYGVNYGEYRLITDYNFNNETNELFDGVNGSIVNTDNILSYPKLLLQHSIIYIFPQEFFISNKDKEKKQVDLFGQYYFHNGIGHFEISSDIGLPYIYITDDTTLQARMNTYMYSGNFNRISTSTYPLLDIVNGNNICLFNVPKENYTFQDNYTNKQSIYTNFWENYLNERYNVNNKIVTCYLRLKPSDFMYFDFNHFIKIGNQIYIINKIYDYDVTSNQSTKVDLVTIQDISAYTN